LDELFVQVLQLLMSEGLADLERVTHDGTKIRAAVGRQSFKSAWQAAEPHVTAYRIAQA
jgi:transposase